MRIIFIPHQKIRICCCLLDNLDSVMTDDSIAGTGLQAVYNLGDKMINVYKYVLYCTSREVRMEG